MGLSLVALLAPYGPLAVYGVIGGGLVLMASVFAAGVLFLTREAIPSGSRVGRGGAIGTAVVFLCTVVAWLTR